MRPTHELRIVNHPMEPTLTYSLAFGRSRIELHPGVLLVAAPARGIPERRIELSTLRHFCIDPIQIMTLLQKFTMDFDADFVVSWGPDGAVEHLRIAVNRQAPDLQALLAALAERSRFAMPPSRSRISRRRQAAIGRTVTARMAALQDVADQHGVPLNLEALFRGMDHCECDDCLSVYSPAAYFVEVLQYLRNNKLGPDPAHPANPNPGLRAEPKDISNTPLEKLFRRRPDLGCLELTCENTFTVLPYIDLRQRGDGDLRGAPMDVPCRRTHAHQAGDARGLQHFRRNQQ